MGHKSFEVGRHEVPFGVRLRKFFGISGWAPETRGVAVGATCSARDETASRVSYSVEVLLLMRA